MCGHVFGLLARDIVRWPWWFPLVRLPDQENELCAPTMLQASRTDPRAFASQPSHPRFGDRLMIETPGLSGHGAPVDGAVAHNGEGDPCELVRYRHSDKFERLVSMSFAAHVLSRS